MLKLRTLLLRDFIYYFIFLVAIIIFLISNFCIKNNSKYEKIENEKLKIIYISKKDYGYYFKLKGKEKIIAYYYTENIKDYNLGDVLIVSGMEKEINNNTVPNTFNYKKYLYNQGIYHVIEINDLKVLSKNKNIFYNIKNYLLKRSFKLKKSYPYINSLLLGENSYIDNDILNSYRENGISHLFAISGLHINIFISILDKVLRKLKIKENTRYNSSIVFLIFYMFVTNFSMSVMRGAIFNILLIINKKHYFYIKISNLLLLTLSIIIFINPLYLNNIGLQFSFVISLFLIVFGNLINRCKSNIGKGLMTSFISFLASYPICVNNFYQVNFLSILYNLFFVPYISTVVLPFTMISYIFIFFDPVLSFLIKILEVTSQFLMSINIFKIIMCKMSLLFIVSYYVLICFILSGLKRSNRKCVVFLVIFFFIHYLSPLKKENYYMMFDVGQGDSSILVVNNKVSMFDTGGIVMYNDSKYTYQLTKNKIIPYLKSYGIRKIDNLFLTHGDYDHMGEAMYLINNFKVGKVIFNCGTYNSLERKLIKILDEKKIEYVRCINEINMKDYKLEILNTKDYGNENSNSSVIYFKYNNYKFLLMGDASKDREHDILDKYKLGKIDFLKVGHHGSDTSSSTYFIDRISPKYSLISVGKNNKYGHPKSTLLDILSNSKIYRTDIDGSVKIIFNKNGYEIKTFNP